MKDILRRHSALRALLTIVLGAAALVAGPVGSGAQDQPARIEEFEDPALQPLTAEEVDQAIEAVGSDERAQVLSGQRVQAVTVERHEEGKDAPAGQRRADVVWYNYDTNETVSAVVSLADGPQLDELTVSEGPPIGFGREELEEARQLALAHPTVQAELRAAGLAGREGELVVTHMQVQAVSPDDPCRTDRCVALFLNTRDAVLGVQPIVNLTTREVEVE
jgi:hypothetical protein